MVSELKPTIGELGESETLARVFPVLPKSVSTIIGPGDDCAVLKTSGESIAITKDLMVEGPDFRLAFSTGFDLGWKACATNLADVAAMGATPTALVVGLVVPAETAIDFVLEIARGFNECVGLLAPGCGVVGGDLTRSDQIMISVTAIGEFNGVEPVTRGGAKPGNLVAVSGELGLAAKGLRLLFERVPLDLAANQNPELATLWIEKPDWLSAQLRPTPPIEQGLIAARSGATAMLDVSDGLVMDSGRIAKASGVAIDLDLSIVGDIDSLTGGEDHALLACFPIAAKIPKGFRVIGRVQSGNGVLVDGVPFDSVGGWDSFSNQPTNSNQ